MTSEAHGSAQETPRVCPAGHPIPVGALLCAICGQPPAAGDIWNQQIAGAYTLRSKRRRRTWLLIALPFAVLVVVLGGLTAVAVTSKWGPFDRSNDVTISVDVLVRGISSDVIDTGDCESGLTGLNDIEDGTQVRILGDQRQVLGVGDLNAGFGAADVAICTYSTSIAGVPDNQEFYRVELGSGRRGDIISSRQELAANGWTFELSIG